MTKVSVVLLRDGVRGVLYLYCDCEGNDLLGTVGSSTSETMVPDAPRWVSKFEDEM